MCAQDRLAETIVVDVRKRRAGSLQGSLTMMPPATTSD
jgi:hypothetical protein